MDANKILSSSLLDLVFDARNKEYGAYDLRKTYHRRIIKALAMAGALVLFIVVGSFLASSMGNNDPDKWKTKEVTLVDIPPEDKKPDPIIEPPKPKEIEVKTVKLTTPVIVPDEKVTEPPPDKSELDDAKIDVKTQEGVPDDQIVAPDVVDEGKGLVPEKVAESNEPFTRVEVEAKFPGGERKWIQFLERNCNAQVATEHGAGVGRYQVVLRFIVDEDGTVSDIRALSSTGFGTEEEALRVTRKAASMKWEPAIQNGRKVKAYRTQPFTFVVED